MANQSTAAAILRATASGRVGGSTGRSPSSALQGVARSVAAKGRLPANNRPAASGGGRARSDGRRQPAGDPRRRGPGRWDCPQRQRGVPGPPNPRCGGREEAAARPIRRTPVATAAVVRAVVSLRPVGPPNRGEHFGLPTAVRARLQAPGKRSGSPEAGWTAARAPTWSHTETRKRHGGPMRTSRLRRCAPALPLNRWHGNVFRPRHFFARGKGAARAVTLARISHTVPA